MVAGDLLVDGDAAREPRRIAGAALGVAGQKADAGQHRAHPLHVIVAGVAA